MVKNAEASLGPVYMLVNCAGFSRAQKFEDLSADLIKVILNPYLVDKLESTGIFAVMSV